MYGGDRKRDFTDDPIPALRPPTYAEEHGGGHLMVLRSLLERLLRINPDGREFSSRYHAESWGVEANENVAGLSNNISRMILTRIRA